MRRRKKPRSNRLAYELVDRRIVRIPRVYAFFTDDQGCGYLVMEFIDGRIIDPLEEPGAIKKVADMLDYFATFRGTVPGSLSRGPCRGLLFPETEDLIFNSTDEMEKWFNSR